MLRQDPDVILIGELRDSETAETALQAAESGHLVLSTMHTLDAAETLGRLVEFFPAVKQPQVRSILAGVLSGVVSQRLLPQHRRRPRRRGRGDGREQPRSQELIRENRPEEIPEAIAEGAFFHMQTLTQALIDLVVGGEVDEETAAPAAPNRHDFMIALERALKKSAAAEERSAGGRGARAGRPRRRLALAGCRHRCAWSDAGSRTASSRLAEDGFTLIEMLVVLAILGIVLAALDAALRVRAHSADGDQTNRIQAQQHARLGARQASPRDPLRERRSTPTSGYPASSITITLGSYCPTAGGAPRP